MAAVARLSLALPVDVFHTQFDTTVTQTQLANNTVLGSADDRDTLASLIEDAEGELQAHTDTRFRETRAGVSGDRDTYPQITYKVSGHNDYKRQWTGVSGDYDPEEVTRSLPDTRVLPFDSAEGDEAYIYRGLRGSTGGSTWEDVTADQGETWDIIDHRNGVLVIHPIELLRTRHRSGHGLAINPSRIRQFRLAISYRHGTLGGSRSIAGSTTLTGSGEVIDSSSTPNSLAVADASRLPNATSETGSLILLIDEEYIRATVDAANDTINVLERGVRGTNAAAHDADERVQYTPPSIRKAVAARAAMSLIQAGRYQAFLPDSEDAIDKGEMLDEARNVWEGTIDALR